MSPVKDGPWHQSRRMGDVAAVLLSNDSSQEDLESAARVVQAAAVVSHIAQWLPFAKWIPLSSTIHTSPVSPDDRPFITRNFTNVTDSVDDDLNGDSAPIVVDPEGTDSAIDTNSPTPILDLNINNIVDTPDTPIFPFVPTTSSPIVRYTTTPTTHASYGKIMDLHYVFPYIPNKDVTAARKKRDLVATPDSTAVMLRPPTLLARYRRSPFTWLINLIHVIVGVFSRVGPGIAAVATRTGHAVASVAGRAGQVVAAGATKFSAFQAAVAQATPQWAQPVVKFVGNVVKHAPVGASIGGFTYGTEKLLDYLDESSQVAHIGPQRFDDNEQFATTVQFFQSSLRGAWTSLAEDHPLIAKVLTRALGVLSVGLLNTTEVQDAPRLFSHENIALLSAFNKDSIAKMSAKARTDVKTMRQWIDLRGQSDLYNQLSTLDIVEKERLYRTENNMSVTDFPPEVPNGRWKVIDALRANLRRTKDEHKTLRHIVFKAAEDEQTAHWSSLLDRSFQPINTNDEFDAEDDADYEYDTASDEERYFDLNSRHDAALADDVNELVRQERAAQFEEDDPEAPPGSITDQVNTLFYTIFQRFRDELIYSPRRYIYCLLLGILCTTLIIIICYHVRKRCCHRRPRTPPIYHEELRNLDTSTPVEHASVRSYHD